MKKIKDQIKTSIRAALSRIGYKITKIVADDETTCYETITSGATYAPWKADQLFLDTYNAIKPYTLVDKYRCYELWRLVEQSKKLQGSIIEIGVWKGGTGALLAKKAALCGIENYTYLCDTFKGVVKAGQHDTFYKGGEHADTSVKTVERLIFDQFNLKNVKILQGIFPDQTSHIVEQDVFRLCHIDVDVYQSAKDVMDWIWDKMVIGGIIVYDDYGFNSTSGVTKYVDEQMQLNDRLILHNLNGHALVIKIS